MASQYKAVVTLKEDMAFEATSTSGHKVMLDAGEEVGGRNLGFRPMELLAMGLGGCTGMDVISLLRKMQQQVSEYQVRVDGVRQDEHPKVYTDMSVEHVVKGKNLQEDKVRRAVELSATKYCPASAMLSKVARVNHYYRMIDEETGEEITGSLQEVAD
jgi:putative redox protein